MPSQVNLPAVPAPSMPPPGAPPWVVEAWKHLGLKEAPGAANNPEIMRWAGAIGVPWVKAYYTGDSLAWCGLGVAYWVKASGNLTKLPASPVTALQWKDFGVAMTGAALGAILVFERRDAKGKLIGGHVGLYLGENATHYAVLGANQGDSVSIVLIPKKRCIAIRWAGKTAPAPKAIAAATSLKPSTSEA